MYTLAGITILWALAAALVPAMQKGNDVARNLHIALNAVNVLLTAYSAQGSTHVS
jgi:type II secretory pathway pseudopilin PulG